MNHPAFPAGPVARVALVAGPLFLALFGLANYVTRIPAVVSITPRDVAVLCVAMALSAMVGFLPALAWCASGCTVMLIAAGLTPLARSPEAWLIAGAGLGAGPFLMASAEPTFSFAFGATGAICALLIHRPLGSSL